MPHVRRDSIWEEPQVPRISEYAYSRVSWRYIEASQGNASLGLRRLGFVHQQIDNARIQAPSSRSKHGDTCPLVAIVVLGGVARNGGDSLAD